MDLDVLERNDRLTTVLARQEKNLELNLRGRLGESQRGVLFETVLQIFIALGFAIFVVQAGSPIPKGISLGLLGLAAGVAFLYLRAPHVLISVRHAEGSAHLVTSEQPHEIQLLDRASGKVMLRFVGPEAQALTAFVEGTRYRFNYLHIPKARSGHYDYFLSAEALPETAA